MLKKVLIAVGLIIVMVSCETAKKAVVKDNSTGNNEDKKEETITREETPKRKVTVYGADKEVQAVEINDKVYYVIGGKDVETMSDQEIKNSSLVSPLKITEESVRGVKGIVVTYYDVKIFLGKKGVAGTTVGIFEPQKNAWTIGDDMDRSQSIQIQLSRGIAGPIAIKRGSISLAYN